MEFPAEITHLKQSCPHSRKNEPYENLTLVQTLVEVNGEAINIYPFGISKVKQHVKTLKLPLDTIKYYYHILNMIVKLLFGFLCVCQ